MEYPEIETVFIRSYPEYNLMGRIKKEDVEEFNKTKNESLILYKFCESIHKSSIEHDYDEIKRQAEASKRLDRKKTYW